MRGQLDSFGRYTGIDISPTAVKRAAERWQDERTSFAVGDVTTAPGRYDVVIVNQIMQVVPDPAALAEGVSRLLEPGGVLLLSIHHDTRRNRLLWKAVDARFACVNAVRVKSESSGRTWRVACYRED